LQDLTVAAAGSILVLWLLSRWLPKTSLYGRLVSSSASGITSVAAVETRHTGSVGRIGVTLSVLRPGGKAQFDDEILDVVAEDGFVDKGQCVRVVGFSGHEAVVQAAGGGRQGA
jgi:membrane-bound serine protease (ClpP class)